MFYGGVHMTLEMFLNSFDFESDNAYGVIITGIGIESLHLSKYDLENIQDISKRYLDLKVLKFYKGVTNVYILECEE